MDIYITDMVSNRVRKLTHLKPKIRLKQANALIVNGGAYKFSHTNLNTPESVELGIENPGDAPLF